MTGDDPQTAPDTGGSWQFKPDGGAPAQQTPYAPAPPDPSAQPPAAPVAGASAPQAGPMQPAPAGDALPFQPAEPDMVVQWTASEFIAHSKDVNWYLGLTGATVVFTAIVYLLTKDKITTGMVIFAAIIFGIYGARKPRTLAYQLSRDGLTIGEKTYDFRQFRSFSVVDEGPFSSIVFMPLKRFMPLITVYYDPADEEKIVKILTNHLPMENRGMDLIDRFLHRIRF